MKGWLSIVSALLATQMASGDFAIQMTNIGDPGNAPDYPYPDPWIPVGSVSYTYQISTYEVSVAQYTEFLNAAAASDPNGLWRESMETGGGIGLPIITRSGMEGSYAYSAVTGRENEPVRYVDFYNGLRLCNWLSNGQGSGDTETGSYTLEDGVWLTRNAGALWALASEDEWYKAAYYDPSTESYYTYPNGSSAVPAEPTDETTPREMNFGDLPTWKGGVYFTSIGETTGHSPYGVYDMGGNVEEWTDTMAWPSSSRIMRGGHLFSPENGLRTTHQNIADATVYGDGFGLRLVYLGAIPEPSSILLMLSGGLVALALRKRRIPREGARCTRKWTT